MNKQIIRLNEEQLHQIVAESVKSVLAESGFFQSFKYTVPITKVAQQVNNKGGFPRKDGDYVQYNKNTNTFFYYYGNRQYDTKIGPQNGTFGQQRSITGPSYGGISVTPEESKRLIYALNDFFENRATQLKRTNTEIQNIDRRAAADQQAIDAYRKQQNIMRSRMQ